MDPISQGAIGAVAPQVVLKPEKIRVAALLGCLAGMAPDLDVFIQSPTDPLLFLEYHRQFTHALVFIPIGAAIVALALHGFVRRRLQLRETYLACLLGYATHGLLDACTSYGTLLLWPFSDYRVAWNTVSVVDPLFTLPLVSLVILAAVRRRRAFAIAGLVWALGYIAFGAVQHQRAEAAGARLAAERGHEPVRLSAKTGFGNLLVWKVVYEHDGRFHVDGIRTGWAATACPGASAVRLDLGRDFPWLDLDSQQALDVERFRWFSSDYLARDPRLPHRIIDVRYSVVPNTIDPLWGVDLDPGATPSSHIHYFVDRRARAEQTDAYWRLITGEDCPVRLDAPPPG
ncbi:MAG: metal-dependent hydrolase [Gammaproteobacteria bacterium]|nr:metal-dependent hydrolase [Gammaproteobacteria bacterium]MYE50907.1 metal-dependent hydrolase [Gammaproteobacteria bacterium]MYG12991.1 metal-dependent hydrolase [Gammaproteobacteria bacterium]MYK28089.1 metal-dependent hydrolase [Gammaproteobacteria bacterium]